MFRKKDKEYNTSLPAERGYGGEALSLRDAMSRLFDESIWDPFDVIDRGGPFRSAEFPKVDISEGKDTVTVVADIPGIDPNNINIEVEDDYLLLSGEILREDEQNEEDQRYYRYEREYGSFSREFMLPSRVNREKVTAMAKNGVLTITLPKVQEEEGDTRTKVPVDVM